MIIPGLPEATVKQVPTWPDWLEFNPFGNRVMYATVYHGTYYLIHPSNYGKYLSTFQPDHAVIYNCDWAPFSTLDHCSLTELLDNLPVALMELTL